jgi:glycosyltransferase involved in cell wall biosynthesis
LKIVQIVTRSDNIGGAQVHLRDLSLELLNRGHSVQVLVGGKGPFLLEMERCGIPVRSLKHLIRPVNPWRDVLAFLELRRLLRLLEPDLAATHTSKAGVIGRLAAWSLGIPAVYTAHGWSFIQEAGPIMKRVYALAEKFAGLLSAGVITVSEYDRSFCLKHRILPPEKVATVHNGIPDVPYIPSEQDTEIPWLIMVARLERPKNHIALLKALALLQHLEWEMNLVGDGPLRSDIEQAVSRLGLTGRVNLLGARGDVPDLLRKFQIFVLCSDMEGLPISILEAMRSGLPVIASDVGGVAEMVDHGVNGFLVRKGCVEELAGRLEVLVRGKELRRRMGAASRQKYEELFHLSGMVDGTLAVYHEVRENSAQ